jgi:hypothetical protein
MKTIKSIRILLVPAILIVYAALFMATKAAEPCDDDCEKVKEVRSAIFNTREDYVLSAGRCSYNRVSDTLCILVRDTSGINWNLLADTACTIATSKGLMQQKIFILKTGTSPFDTLAKKICP